MLAAVEYDQSVLVAQAGCQPRYRVDSWQRDAQHRGEGARHQLGISQRGEPDEPDAILIRCAHSLGDPDRNRCLADPTRPDDGQKTALSQLGRQGRDDVVAPDDAGERRRQITTHGRSVRSAGWRLPLLARHRRHKAVTPARIVGDIACSGATIAKRLAQRGDMDPERPFVDDRVGPGAGDQLIFVNRVAGVFNKRDEDV